MLNFRLLDSGKTIACFERVSTMSKIKKWIYPLIFLLSSVVGLLLFYVLLSALVASKIFTNGWGALFVLLIAVLLWGFILLPLYCLKYGKRVQAERFSVFFVFYNAFVIVMPFVLPLIRYEETYAYGFISFLWVLAWAAFPLLSAKELRKKRNTPKPCCLPRRALPPTK